jgi:putative DNA primase/helicase
MTRLAPTPRFFTLNALEFDPDPNAPAPMAWFAFLHQLFQGDEQSLDLLQEWFAYCLTGDTSLQKMLLLIGPKRSGKGTIGRVLRQLVGPGNVCSPTTSSLAGPFGLQPLLGKSLALVSDARFHGEHLSTVVERLLCISGEDAITVDRKFKESVTVTLPTRFLFMTNECPKLTDASGALAGRFVALQLTQSFYGHEDPTLTSRLLAELPGILNWAIEGWHRLRARGRFAPPESVAELLEELEDLSSPVKAFVRERCQVGSGLRTSTADLYVEWRNWCQAAGRDHPGTSQSLGRDLRAAFPTITSRRGTDNLRFYEGVAIQGAPR